MRPPPIFCPYALATWPYSLCCSRLELIAGFNRSVVASQWELAELQEAVGTERPCCIRRGGEIGGECLQQCTWPRRGQEPKVKQEQGFCCPYNRVGMNSILSISANSWSYLGRQEAPRSTTVILISYRCCCSDTLWLYIILHFIHRVFWWSEMLLIPHLATLCPSFLNVIIGLMNDSLHNLSLCITFWLHA